MQDEKRRFTRVPFSVQANVTVDGVTYTVNQINNLSIGGCSLSIDVELEPNSDCRLQILMSGASNESVLKIEGQIIRCH